MGDEASKKDLQTLQSNLNKQVTDLKKQIADLESKFNKGLDEENKITVTVRQDLTKRMDGFESRATELQNSINTLARAISDIASKVKK